MTAAPPAGTTLTLTPIPIPTPTLTCRYMPPPSADEHYLPPEHYLPTEHYLLPPGAVINRLGLGFGLELGLEG